MLNIWHVYYYIHPTERINFTSSLFYEHSITKNLIAILPIIFDLYSWNYINNIAQNWTWLGTSYQNIKTITQMHTKSGRRRSSPLFFPSLGSLAGKLPNSGNGRSVSDTTFNSSAVITFAGTKPRVFTMAKRAPNFPWICRLRKLFISEPDDCLMKVGDLTSSKPQL